VILVSSKAKQGKDYLFGRGDVIGADLDGLAEGTAVDSEMLTEPVDNKAGTAR
jgi:hypothetical protein